MAKLIYSAITSLDLFVNDSTGGFDWAAPDAELHAFVNELERPIGTYLLGRRIYEVMRFWESPPDLEAEPEEMREYASIWRAADKVVYSSTLPDVTTARTRLERRFDAATVHAMKVGSDRDLSVGGPTLAAVALRAGLVDEVNLFLHPVAVGDGTRALPDDLRLDLDLLDERRFSSGVVHLHYRVS